MLLHASAMRVNAAADRRFSSPCILGAARSSSSAASRFCGCCYGQSTSAMIRELTQHISREEIANAAGRASLQHEARRAVLATSQAHDAGDGDGLLLRLDPLALPQLDPVVLLAPVSARPEKIGAFRIGRVFRRRGRRYGWRLRQRPHSEETGRSSIARTGPSSSSASSVRSASCCRCCSSRT